MFVQKKSANTSAGLGQIAKFSFYIIICKLATRLFHIPSCEPAGQEMGQHTISMLSCHHEIKKNKIMTGNWTLKDGAQFDKMKLIGMY